MKTYLIPLQTYTEIKVHANDLDSAINLARKEAIANGHKMPLLRVLDVEAYNHNLDEDDEAIIEDIKDQSSNWITEHEV